MTVEEKLNKAAYLLGLASGGLRSMTWYGVDDKCHAQLSALFKLVETLDQGIQDIFYSEDVKP